MRIINHLSSLKALFNTFFLSALVCYAPLSLAQTPNNTKNTSSAVELTENKNVTLNFVNTEITQAIRAVGVAIGKTYIIDPRVKGTLTLISEKPVSVALATYMLQAALRLHGYATVENKNFTRVVPEADAKLQTGAAASSLNSGQVLTHVFHLNYESASALIPVLRPLVSPNMAINAYSNNNSIIVTDYADNIKRIAQAIKAIDNMEKGGHTETITLLHKPAADAVIVVQRLLGEGRRTAATPQSVNILSDPRTNSVILFSQNPARMHLARQALAQFDQPSQQLGNIYVVPLKNADAVELAQTLRAIVAADSTLKAGDSTSNNQTGATPNTTTATPTSSSMSNYSSSSSNTGTGLGSNVSFTNKNLPETGGIIQADSATNSLIITASEPTYRNLRNVIEQLDVRRAQIYVEAMIVEVTSDITAQLGIQWQGFTGSKSGNNIGFAGSNFGDPSNNIFNLSLAANSIANGNMSTAQIAQQKIPPGLNVGILHKFDNFLSLGALLNAFSSNGSVNVLSTPNLITLDNEEASILIGRNVPVVNGSYAQTSQGVVSPYQTFDRENVGIQLKVKPQITDGNVIKLQIYQETSSVIADTSANASGPSFNKRSLQTTALIDDGQIMVLGGLIEDSYSDGFNKVPLLGDLPLIGFLFRTENKSRRKTNLLVFLRPYVMRTKAQTHTITKDQYNYIRDQQKNFVSPNHLIRDSQTPMLPGEQTGEQVIQLIRPDQTAPSTSPLIPNSVPTQKQSTPASNNPFSSGSRR